MNYSKYKEGDKVLIKDIDWYNKNKDKNGVVVLTTHLFTPGMSQFCGKVMTIEEIFEDIDDNVVYYMEEIDCDWTDEMIEGLVEEEFEVDLIPKFGEYSDNEPLDIPTMTTEFVKEHGLPCPEGYIFKDENGNEILTSKIILEKKKKEYPKTYEECLSVLGIYNGLPDVEIYNAKPSECTLFETLIRLKRCRDAYWKIAGKEMGLGKSWEPDWTDYEHKKFVFIVEGNTLIEKEYSIQMCVLAFPTEEMRDAFKKNFDSDIEICKEFL